MFRAVSHRIEAERVFKHIGTASIKLNVLVFPHSKELNLKKVERLKKLFQESDCIPDDLPNRIPAIIHESQLQESLNASEISRQRLLSSDCGNHAKLEFPPSFRLECLRGRHRVKAAEETPKYTDKRWVIDLFLAGMAYLNMRRVPQLTLADISEELKSALVDEYASEREPDDGEFYFNIRVYQGVFGQKNRYFEKRWWARLAAVSLSTNKKDRLKQLFRHRRFAPAFDAFRYLPALYCGMRLSVLNKMISMGCHEVRIFPLYQNRKANLLGTSHVS